MAADEEGETLESWLNKATNPLNTEEKWEYIKGFCDQVNLELEGPQIATRLLGHKIQSPQEREALYALTVLDTCMKNCGKRFQNEVGKFRFLNDLIKVLSPKYLGLRSSEQVKSKVIEMLYSWTVWLPNEIKIRDAYQMLKKQGVIKRDPKLPDEKPLPPPSPREKSSLFDDDEKAKLLARLLKSNHPEDLQAANRLIKNVIREDEEKADKINKRVHVIAEVTNSTKLLNEMLTMYQKDGLPENQIEILKNLYQRCEKLRPTLFRLASDTVDNDEALAEILQTNDSLALAVNSYKKIMEGHEVRVAPRNSAKKETASLLADLTDLELDFGKPGSYQGSGCEQQLPRWLDEELMSLGLNDPPMMEQATGAVNQNTSQEANAAVTAPSSTSSGSRDLDGLDLLGSTLMEQLLGHQTRAVQWDQLHIKPTLKDLQNQALSHPLAATLDLGCPATSAPLVAPSPPSQSTVPSLGTPELIQACPSQLLHRVPVPQEPSFAGTDELSWKTLFVPLDSIQTSHIPPVTAFDRNGFRVLFHFAKASPSRRPDLLVVIISLLSSSPAPIKGILFQAAVPKVMRVKLQSASGTELPSFNPLLPPPVISQVMLLDNPQKEKVRLRYKLHYILAEQPFTEFGEVTKFPAVETWGSL
ncbi:LOW QUALITY PROTEIN: ADP-ribosylation factor-binding protein GGA1-like [Pristis pectinata]|uniref:LOW QUALITY PROTEIN: ADP-ribosylation factor-binding protein GGA1-like n=1 Tax=Pristis pectinata TaxID=685728 RepID=UPI00223DE4DE|nr:LOW QUALITY PROTEIN: ADP-ribosylation factor-binding protein GGA1-like [Pristis pectinata]